MELVKKMCLNCGQDFVSLKHWNKRYCGEECNRQALRARRFVRSEQKKLDKLEQQWKEVTEHANNNDDTVIQGTGE